MACFCPTCRSTFTFEKRFGIIPIAVGAVAAMISRTCGCSDPSLVFVAGTLHDIGLCASERLDRESFTEVVSQIDELSPTHEVEDDLLGWNHAQLGAAVLEQWGMPEEVQMAARYHHTPDQAINGPYARDGRMRGDRQLLVQPIRLGIRRLS